MNKTAPLFLILILTLSSFAQTSVERFDQYVEAARKEWKVPGLSIAVVQDGKVVFVKGYGVRELGKNESVNTSTLFGCMSTTKAMTVATLAMLVDEGKVRWDDKVIKYLPDFRIADPYITNEIRVRDLLTHNAGLGNADFLWGWTPNISNDEIMKRMQLAQPVYSLRSSFIYQNIMYGVAGQIVAKVSGMPWEQFVVERLFKPLGMNNSYPNLTLSKGYANRSVPHYEIEGKIQVIPESPADAIAPAGAAQSTADDIAKWVAFVLSDGTVNGKTLIKPATMAEIFKPQVMVPPSQFYPTVAITKPHWMTYGLAWFQHDYRGEMINYHTGSLAGRTAIVGLLRDKNLGVYIFGNLDHAEVRHALMYKAFDVFGFNDFSRDWSKEFKTLYDGIEAQGNAQTAAARARRVPNTKPTHDLAAYVGKYSDPYYGDLEVTMSEGNLRLTIGGERNVGLEHWHYDTFQTKPANRWQGSGFASFQLNAVSGDVDSITVGGATFRRVRTSAGGNR